MVKLTWVNELLKDSEAGREKDPEPRVGDTASALPLTGTGMIAGAAYLLERVLSYRKRVQGKIRQIMG